MWSILENVSLHLERFCCLEIFWKLGNILLLWDRMFHTHTYIYVCVCMHVYEIPSCLRFPPAPPWDSPRWASGSDTGCFQISASDLGPRLCGLLSAPFRNGVSASYKLLLLLLLSRVSHVRLCATPETAAHQAPPSLGFSSQEHWSGLPFPSPMHEREKWMWSHSGCLLESYTVMSNS